MEGALASVVGGLTPAPVVAVPTSTGYGAAFEGLTALLAMLAACASGVTVVGIDNGYGAACAIARLLSVNPAATAAAARDTVAWFHCFAGIAGDMALGSLIDAGADLDEIRLLLDRLSLPGWELHGRGGAPGRRGLHAGPGAGRDDDTVRPHPADIVGAHHRGRPAAAGDRAGAGRLPSGWPRSSRRCTDARSIEVHFHEVGRARRHHRHRRHRRRARGARRRRGHGVAGGHRNRHGPRRRTASSPIRRRPRSGCSRASRPTGAPPRWSSPPRPAPRSLAALSTSFGPMPAMVVAASGFGGGAERDRGAAQLHPGRHRADDDRRRPSVRGNRPWCSRRTSTT